MVVPPPIVQPPEALSTLAADALSVRPRDAKSPALVVSKLHLPPLPRQALSRRRLNDVLRRDGRLVLVSAPAGFGKSTLVAQWAAAGELPVAWVTLDTADSDPIRFWLHVISALEQAIPGGVSSGMDLSAFTNVSRLVGSVVNRMCALEPGAVLVLDDYHEIRSREIDQSMERLISLLPAMVRVVILTRRDPDLALNRLRASEQLVEVRQHDLRYTDEEAAEWLAGRGIDATPDVVRESQAITEGWPAAYTLLFGSGRRPTEVARGFNRRHVTEYVREEVVRDHEDDWPLLAVAAFCPEITVPLLEHTLDLADGHAALARLERSNLLLERVDHHGEWYRLHRLVADHLLLGHESEADVHQLMMRAAEWYTTNDRAPAAFDILVRAGEDAAACDVINRSWLGRLRRGELATLRTDLSRIAPDVAAASAPFLVTRAWLHAHSGRRRDATRDLARAESIAPVGPLPDGCPSVGAARAVINALYAVEGLNSVDASVRSAESLVDDTSPWRPVARLAIGYGSFLTGDLTTAQVAFDDVLASPDPLLRSLAVGWSAVIDVMESRFDSARTRFDDEAPMWLEHPPLSKLPAVIVAGAALACAEGRPIEAASALEECRAGLGTADPTDRLEVLLWLAAAELSIGRTNRATQWRDEAERILERLGGSAWHSERLRKLEARMEPRPERNGRDPGLTDRERRILQLLSATHLSQREIGRELGVSFNTIKSHVKAIYVKLGATSREEASQIARNRGLI